MTIPKAEMALKLLGSKANVTHRTLQIASDRSQHKMIMQKTIQAFKYAFVEKSNVLNHFNVSSTAFSGPTR